MQGTDQYKTYGGRDGRSTKKKKIAQGKIEWKYIYIYICIYICTPINPNKYSCYGLKKIHTRNLITKKVAKRPKRRRARRNGRFRRLRKKTPRPPHTKKKVLEPYTLTCSPLKWVYLLMCLSIEGAQKSPFNILVVLEISMHLFDLESALPLEMTLMHISVNCWRPTT